MATQGAIMSDELKPSSGMDRAMQKQLHEHYWHMTGMGYLLNTQDYCEICGMDYQAWIDGGEIQGTHETAAKMYHRTGWSRL